MCAGCAGPAHVLLYVSHPPGSRHLSHQNWSKMCVLLDVSHDPLAPLLPLLILQPCHCCCTTHHGNGVVHHDNHSCSAASLPAAHSSPSTPHWHQHGPPHSTLVSRPGSSTDSPGGSTASSPQCAPGSHWLLGSPTAAAAALVHCVMCRGHHSSDMVNSIAGS
jgi:hypothetical protein